MPQEEYVTATEARDILGVSQSKVAQMLADGTLAWIRDPFNKNAKLIKRSDLQAMLDSAPRHPRPKRKRQPAPETTIDMDQAA